VVFRTRTLASALPVASRVSWVLHAAALTLLPWPRSTTAGAARHGAPRGSGCETNLGLLEIQQRVSTGSSKFNSGFQQGPYNSIGVSMGSLNFQKGFQ
jgi:hypothetical protein